jgi:hypothetical protein
MKSSWKPTLFILLNFVFAICLTAALYLFITVLGGEDPLALLGILYLDIAFVGIGVFLNLLGRTHAVSTVNKTLPFVAVVGLTVTALLNVSDFSLWLGIAASLALFLACVVTTLTVIMKR